MVARGPRKSVTYRSARRNAFFGRKPHGTTTPTERREIWKTHGVPFLTTQEKAELKTAPM